MPQPPVDQRRQNATTSQTRTSGQTQASPAETDKPISWIENTLQESLTITHWVEPVEYGDQGTLTIRFTGKRANIEGRAQSGDQFVQDEIISGIVPGCGPVAVSAHIRDINSGEWNVTAHLLESNRVARKRKAQQTVTPSEEPERSSDIVAKIWRGWGASTASTKLPKTTEFPLARIPAIIPGIWPVLVGLGIVVAILAQMAVINRLHLSFGTYGWLVLPITMVAGFIGSKIWFVVKMREEQRWEGWCIQGFLLGATLGAIGALLWQHQPVGAFFDSIAPGTLLGMAVGRLGCFFGGCCGGPPTSAWWGVWSSDQCFASRRVPTQLLESGFSLIAGLVELVAVMNHWRGNGAYFVAAIAAYTLARQGILRLRSEQHTAKWDIVVTALSALVLVASLVVVIA